MLIFMTAELQIRQDGYYCKNSLCNLRYVPVLCRLRPDAVCCITASGESENQDDGKPRHGCAIWNFRATVPF
jgi:hypothetical protein